MLDDGAAAPPAHRVETVERHADGAEQIGLDGLDPMLERSFRMVARPGGVVDHHIQAAARAFRKRDQRADLGLDRHVRHPQCRAAALGFDMSVTTTNAAFPCQPARDRPATTGPARSGHNGGAASQIPSRIPSRIHGFQGTVYPR